MTIPLPQPVILQPPVPQPKELVPDTRLQSTSMPKKEPLAEVGTATALTVTCKQEDLARGLALVAVAVLEHSTLPILKNILLSTDRGRLRLSATTLEIGVQVWIDAEISSEGTTAVPAVRFRKIIGTLQPGQVRLVVPAGSQTLTISNTDTRTTIRSDSDPREFPVIPTIEGNQQTATLDTGLFKTMVEQVEYAADKDLVTKPTWASIKVELAEGSITLAAADTFKVAERIAPLSAEAGACHAEMLVPARSLTKLAGILPTIGKVTLMVTAQGNQVIFRVEQAEQIEFVSRLIEGKYPNYRRAFPKEHTTRVVVDTKRVIKAIERAALFAVDEKRSVRLTVKPASASGSLFASLVIDADDASLGESISSIPAEVSGPEQVVFFPVENIQQALAHIDTPQVALEIRETGKPVILKPVGDIAYVNLIQTMYSPKTEA